MKSVTTLKIKCRPTSCSVDPGVVVAMPGCHIKFENLSTDDVYIQGSAGELFLKKGSGRRNFQLPSYKIRPLASATFAVGRLKRGIYPYAVFCNCTMKFCTGGSMPIIIVPR